MSILATMFFTFVVGVSIYAQDDPAKTVNGGVINGKAVKMVKPEFPAAAKAVGASGVVNVEVILDEEGNVTTAKAISGHALLRKSSEEAALASKFSLTKLEDKPIKVKGIVVYNFVSGNDSPKQTAIIQDFKKFGEVLNAKALSLPIPKYPAAAKAVNADGAVIVEIIIDEKGNVISAETVYGHALLKKESENAAFKATFEPTLIDGKAVKTKGVLVYNFVAN